MSFKTPFLSFLFTDIIIVKVLFLYTVRKVLVDFTVLYETDDPCKAQWVVQFGQIEENGRKFRHLELSNKFSNSVPYPLML